MPPFTLRRTMSQPPWMPQGQGAPPPPPPPLGHPMMYGHMPPQMLRGTVPPPWMQQQQAMAYPPQMPASTPRPPMPPGMPPMPAGMPPRGMMPGANTVASLPAAGRGTASVLAPWTASSGVPQNASSTASSPLKPIGFVGASAEGAAAYPAPSHVPNLFASGGVAFEQSSEWKGPKRGYVYTSRTLGTGYYKDEKVLNWSL